MKDKQTIYESLVIVEGSGNFPVDMLRYDRCVPNRETDSHKIQEYDSGMRRIALLRLSKRAAFDATEKRWESFGWHVIWQGNSQDDVPELEVPEMEAQSVLADKSESFES